ncbi:MAG: hypothetical protein FWE29_03150 [Defluviitaleaceae bacterium]|nr:hypothetical protein [Defluviitaleaceae bacterium]
MRNQVRPAAKGIKPKKGKKAVSILVSLSIIILIVMAFVYFRLHSAETADLGFNPERAAEAYQLYQQIINFDHITDYPETPEEVMELYLKTVRLLYGDMLRNEYFMVNVIERQRTFLSEDILSRNRIGDQVYNFFEKLEELQEMNVVTFYTEQRPPIFPNIERNVCQIRVIKYNTGVRNTHLVYTLSADNPSRRWRIIYWEVTDSNFNPITEID